MTVNLPTVYNGPGSLSSIARRFRIARYTRRGGGIQAEAKPPVPPTKSQWSDLVHVAPGTSLEFASSVFNIVKLAFGWPQLLLLSLTIA